MIDGKPARIRSSWNTTAWLIRGPLTDRKIKKYEKEGWYSSEFRELRRKKMAHKKWVYHNERIGNFFECDGRLIYNPI